MPLAETASMIQKAIPVNPWNLKEACRAITKGAAAQWPGRGQRGTEYCGQREHHEYELYLAVENIDHSRTKARHPQTNGICER